MNRKILLFMLICALAGSYVFGMKVGKSRDWKLGYAYGWHECFQNDMAVGQWQTAGEQGQIITGEDADAIWAKIVKNAKENDEKFEKLSESEKIEFTDETPLYKRIDHQKPLKAW